MNKSPSLSSKLSTWILMLLVWNIALLSIALFFLIRVIQPPASIEDISQACIDALTHHVSPAL